MTKRRVVLDDTDHAIVFTNTPEGGFKIRASHPNFSQDMAASPGAVMVAALISRFLEDPEFGQRLVDEFHENADNYVEDVTGEVEDVLNGEE